MIFQVNRYNSSNSAWRIAFIHRLIEVAEKNDSKQRSTFRSSAITLFAVLLAIASLLVPPALETIFGANTSSDKLTQLERRKEDSLINLLNISKIAQEQRAINPAYVVPQDELGEASRNVSNSSNDYYAAVNDNGWAKTRATFALVITVILVLLVVNHWRVEKGRARKADEQRARAATWLKLFSEQKALIIASARKSKRP
ncbi:hypothetical protein [Clavibacter sp. VKM Ac-2542]|uniref:hypothetical protein n=1 Tax=Clavibacter sp. VKM Ac-2542 TaxID=2783811 RepID=UPI00188C5BA5|nr:hypothetical protein [Clavibacter sp. VKM Ac-2542]MBF4621798.1 hypothetical protein [Clavibacter sp. VKM Ac-2542]